MHIHVIQTRKFFIELENYKGFIDKYGVRRDLTDPQEILQFEKEQLEHGELSFEEIDCIVGTSVMLVEE